jgi:UDP-glucose 4-epimerase
MTTTVTVGSAGAPVGAAPSAGAGGLLEAFNFGTGTGSTVLELIAAMEQASGKKVAYTVGPRRAGDLPAAFADIAKAKAVLGWEPKFTLLDSCRDAWNWQSNNPRGYE